MKQLPFNREKISVGLHLGPEGIFLSSLKKTKTQDIQMLSSAKVAMPHDAFENGVIVDQKEIAQIIKKLFVENEIAARNVWVTLSKPDVVTRIVTLPQMSKKQTRDALQQEVDKYIIFGGEETLIDWNRIDNTKVLLTATKRNITTSIIDTFVQAGLNVEAIEVLPLSFIRLFLFSEKLFCSDKVVMLVLIAENATDIAIIKNGNFSFFHSFDTVDPLNFIREVEMASAYWGEESPNSPIEKIIVFTDNNKVKNTYNKFSKKIGVDIIDGSAIVSSLLKTKTVGDEYIYMQGATLGLALRGVQKKPLFGINLVPPEKIKIDLIKRSFFLVFIFLASAFLILFALNLLFTALFGSYKKKLIPIKQRLETSANVLLEIKKINAKKEFIQRRLKERVDFVEQLDFVPWVEILDEIRKFMPQEVWLDSISVEDGMVLYLEGTAYSQDVVYKYVNLLEYSDYFNEPRLVEIESIGQQGIGPQAAFSISCPLSMVEQESEDEN